MIITSSPNRIYYTELQNALLQGFDQYEVYEIGLCLGIRLNTVIGSGIGLEAALLKLIDLADEERWLFALVREAHRKRPKSEPLRKLAGAFQHEIAHYYAGEENDEAPDTVITYVQRQRELARRAQVRQRLDKSLLVTQTLSLVLRQDGTIEANHERNEHPVAWSDLQRKTIHLFERQLIQRLIKKSDDLRILGRHLFEMLIRGDIEKAYARCIDAADEEQSRLRLELAFENPAIQNWPWEYLCDVKRDFLALDTRLTLTRRVRHLSDAPLNPNKQRPLNILLLVITQLPDQSAIFTDDAEKSFASSMERALNVVERPRYPLQLHSLVDPTVETMLQKLEALHQSGQSPDVVHIISYCRHQDGSGEIALHGATNQSIDWCNIKRLTSCFGQNNTCPRLVFLQAAVSESAIEAGTTYKIFSDWAINLHDSGTPALVAMPFERGGTGSLFGRHATFFAETFYKNLARGQGVDVAVQDARLTLHNLQHDDGRLFGTPVIYLQSADAELTLPPQPQSFEPEATHQVSARPEPPAAPNAHSRPNVNSSQQAEQLVDTTLVQAIMDAGEKRLQMLPISPAERDALQQKMADLEHLLPTVPLAELKQFLLDYGYYEDRQTKLVILAMSQAVSAMGDGA